MISKSEYELWKNEFTALKCDLFGKHFIPDIVAVKRLDAEFLSKTLITNEYRSVSGDRNHWTKGYFVFSNSYIEIDATVRGEGANGDRWGAVANSVGLQLKDLTLPPWPESADDLKCIIVVYHDDGDFNGSNPVSEMVIYKVPKRGTETLLNEYWAGIKRAIEDEIAKADTVGIVG